MITRRALLRAVQSEPRVNPTVNPRLKKQGSHGSILFETLLTLFFIVLPLCGMQMELIRAAQYQVVLHHISFLLARSVGLGGEARRAFIQATQLVTEGLGDRERFRILNKSDWFVQERGGGLEAKVRYRYPGLIPVFYSRPQMTKKCLFCW